MSRRFHLILIAFCLHLIYHLSIQQDETEFIYNGFSTNDLYLGGIAKVLPGRLLQLTNTTEQQKGHAFFKTPLEFNLSVPFSFSTHFVCALVAKPGITGGNGLVFVISPSRDLSHAAATQYFGIFNISTIGDPSSNIFSIELDTVESAEFNDIDNNHVGINVNSLVSISSSPASYFSSTERKNKSLSLLSGKPIQVWVDYDRAVLNVTIAPSNVHKPSQPLLSELVNLSQVFREKMFIGFSASTGRAASDHYILGWSFSRSTAMLLQSLDISKLPRVPQHPREPKKLSLFVVFSIIVLGIALLGTLVGVYMHRRKRYAEVREVWEKEYGPRRFSYKMLHKATKGFDERRLIGKGGFGEVYRGNLGHNSVEIAVKRVSHDAEEGMKQFVAEIVSMGNLEHRNLVPLLGYCRRKGEFFLISEYMANGSLDNYLFDEGKPSLSWPQRLVILKGIASALSYLHNGANQVVLHRDIKASNVMLDSDLNGRLGDFGMARFHDHGADLTTTRAVGTIGYMAPELGRTGASTMTDVYAFGVFVFEVVCGRRPVEPTMCTEQRYLTKWVWELWKKDGLVNVKDPKLIEEIPKNEIEMVVKIGLLCTSVEPDSRPAMEEVMRYLDGSLPLSDVGSYGSPVAVGEPGLSSLLSDMNSSQNNSSIFMTHSIIYGDGR